MLASVTRLTPRLGSIENALAAFRAARLQHCLAELHGVETPAARALRARALLRLGNAKGALSAVDIVDGDDGDRAEISLLRGVAQSRLGAEDDADLSFRDAYVYSVSSMDVSLEAEVEFYKGLRALNHGDFQRARESCEAGIKLAENSTLRFAAACRIPLEHVIAKTLELLGVIDASQGRYRDLLDHARGALATLDRCSVRDIFQEAFELKNLAILARDFDIEHEAGLLAERIPSFAWTPEIARVEFAATEALGWCSALRGDSVSALRSFRRAERAASSNPERIIIGVDRALLAREFGHGSMVIEEVENAVELAREFNWETAAGDSREALLSLAQASAPIVPLRARELLDRYTTIRNAMDGTFAARFEPRARAEEDYTHGLVLRAEGRVAASAERLQTAFETWGKIGYEWRAGRAALELAELNAGDIFRNAVRRELSQRPDSVFSARARLVA